MTNHKKCFLKKSQNDFYSFWNFRNFHNCFARATNDFIFHPQGVAKPILRSREKTKKDNICGRSSTESKLP